MIRTGKSSIPVFLLFFLLFEIIKFFFCFLIAVPSVINQTHLESAVKNLFPNESVFLTCSPFSLLPSPLSLFLLPSLLSPSELLFIDLLGISNNTRNKLKFPESGNPLEVDIWISDRNLCFEFQVYISILLAYKYYKKKKMQKEIKEN